MTFYSQVSTGRRGEKPAMHADHRRVSPGFGFAVLTLLAGSAFGQAAGPAAPTGAESTQLQEVVVTGSRIPQPNMTSTSPIQVVTSQEIKLEGTTNISDLL